MTNLISINSKFLGLSLGILLIVSIVSLGFIDSTYAANKNVKVGCKSLALDLITWDQLLGVVSEQDIVDNEHELNEEGVEPDLYEDIIDEHLEDLLDEVEDECDNLDDDVDRMIGEIQFKLP